MGDKNIYPSNLRNYFLKDTLLDYLNLYCDPSHKDVSTFPEADFTKLMFDLGNEYESHVVAKLISLCNKLDLTYYQVDRNNKNQTPYAQTKNAFQLRVDVIFQPFLKDWSTNTAGYPDIVISKLAYKKIFHENLITVDKFSEQSYFVIDVKYSTINTQTETDYQRFIRAQVCIYNTLLTTVLTGLKIMTKPSPNVGFILAKGESDEPLGKLIMLQLEDMQLNKDIYSAIQWVNKVRKEGKNWSIDSQRPYDKQTQSIMKELFPNMGNKYDYPWHSYKGILAERFKDVSHIWGIGTKIRSELRENKIIDFEDEMLGEELSQIINQDTQKYKNINQIVSTLLDSIEQDFSLKNIDKRKFIYFDLEGCYEFKMFEKGRQYITMIGFGQYIHQNNKKMDLETNWIQKTFFIDKLDPRLEEEMITNAINYLKMEQNDSELILLHYTSAENQFLKMLREKGVIFKSVDLAICFKYFWEKGIIDVNINNFRLKTVMQRFLELGYLDMDIYKESKIKSGMEVASIYNQVNKLDKQYRESLINEIIKYNESDCKSLYIIHLLFKTKVSL